MTTQTDNNDYANKPADNNIIKFWPLEDLDLYDTSLV